MAQILVRINRAILLSSRPLFLKCISEPQNGSSQIPLISRFLSILTPNPLTFNQMPLLQSFIPTIQQSCGMKVKGKLRRRCKDCYFVWREESKLF